MNKYTTMLLLFSVSSAIVGYATARLIEYIWRVPKLPTYRENVKRVL